MQSATSSEFQVPRLLVLVGLPGSGKSSWARDQGVAVLSSDHIRFLLADDENDQTIHSDVFATLRYLLRRRLQLRRPLTIVDATNITARERRPYIRIAQFHDYRVEAMHFDTSVEICKERNRARSRSVPDEVIDRMAQHMVAPSIAEGFDVVITFRSGPAAIVTP